MKDYPSASENFLNVEERAQKAINKDCPDELSIARRIALEELEKIARSDKSEEERIAEIQERFPDSTTQLLRAAEEGNAEAQFKLGVCYCHGDGVEKDMEEAVKWFRMAAEQGNADAEYNLGGYYEDEAQKWYSKAVDGVRKKAEQGDAEAQYCLGLIYANGRGVEKDMVEAVKWYRMAAEQGMAAAQHNLGECYAAYDVKEKIEEAMKWYRMAAEQGYAKAQYTLGMFYVYGYVVEKDMERGIWEVVVKKDMEEAVKWFRKAAESSDVNLRSDSLLMLGFLYEAIDKKTPEMWYYKVADLYRNVADMYHKEAEAGDVDSQLRLAECYELGIGVSADMEEALKWYRKAAESGNMWGQKVLESFRKERIEELFSAANRGNAEAQFNLANWYGERIYQLPSVCEKSEKVAFYWYRKAAEQGDAAAQYMLGKFYEDGIGVKKDRDEALRWYRKAAEHGNEDAKKALKEIEK